jgi:hypothetical protein
MGAQRDSKLAEEALNMALLKRRPQSGLRHHSDRGSATRSSEMSFAQGWKAKCFFKGTLTTECSMLGVIPNR